MDPQDLKPMPSALDTDAGAWSSTDVSDPGQSDNRHSRTTGPAIHLVQPGWHVYDRIGQRLGEVMERDGDSMVVSLEPTKKPGTRIPVEFVVDEVPDGRWATLSVTKRELS